MTTQMSHPTISPRVYGPRRPGLVTFAAVMLFILSFFYLIAAITEWSNSVWLYDRDFKVVGSRLIFWGFVDAALCALSVYGGYLLWAGRRAGQILGFAFAGISFVRWMFYIPANPWLAIAILVVNGLIIYGLSTNDDWFAEQD